VITIEQALAQKQFVLPTTVLERGDPAALGASAHRLQGRLRCGGQ
jgi:xanthine dehydrogenase molybdopterin-binding subunit B